MPYVKQENRDRIDWIVDNLASELGVYGVTGNLNYFLYKLFKKLKSLGYLDSYQTFSRFLAELDMCKMELYRRELAPYEDEKIKENGDV